jgi:hypothetical protein
MVLHCSSHQVVIWDKDDHMRRWFNDLCCVAIGDSDGRSRWKHGHRANGILSWLLVVFRLQYGNYRNWAFT